jgi:hypothetical protein
MKTCEDCGERVYSLGCTYCNELAYIAEQVELAEDDPPADIVKHQIQRRRQAIRAFLGTVDDVVKP